MYLTKEEPMVSIVIPVYNGSNFLQQAIDSALSQTYKNCEVIVVNDGSDDGGATERIALSYGDRIRYFAKENGGVATAFNMGIEKMRGEYFSLFTHDDVYYPYKIEKQIEALRQSGDMYAPIFGAYDILDMQHKRLIYFDALQNYTERQITNGVFGLLFGAINSVTVLLHKSCFEKEGVFNPDLKTTQDYDMFFRAFRGKRCVFLSTPLIRWRLHDDQGSITESVHPQAQDELHLGFAQQLTEQEAVSMFGSLYCCYYELLRFSIRGKFTRLYQYISEKFYQQPQPENTEELQNEFRRKIMLWGNGRAEKLCLFGAGRNGMQLMKELTARNVQVAMFADNHPSKIGKEINGIPCVDIRSVCLENTLIVITPNRYEEIREQLVKLGCNYMTLFSDVMKMISCVPTSDHEVVKEF